MMYANACRITVAVCALAALAAAVPGAEPMRERKVRTLLESERAVYRVYYEDNDVGTETVTRRTYDDNTIVYQASVDLHMKADVAMSEEAELVLEDESRFPRSYHMTKTMTNAQTTLETRTDVEMFANVARLTRDVGGQVEERNVVLPTGTPLVSSNVVYPVFQLLYWYDRDRGGRQAFEVFEVARRETNKLVLDLQKDRESVAFAGAMVETDVYVLELATGPQRYFVDDEGRIIVAQMGFLRAELVEWADVEEDGEG